MGMGFESKNTEIVLQSSDLKLLCHPSGTSGFTKFLFIGFYKGLG
jgi:hypothetical protein